MSKPLLQARFVIPTVSSIDRKLLLGGILFGTGWGISGLCPGPAIVSLPAVTPQLATYIAAMVAGMAFDRQLSGGVAKAEKSA